MNARISGNTRSISLRKRLSSCKTVTEKPKAELLRRAGSEQGSFRTGEEQPCAEYADISAGRTLHWNS